VELPMNSELLLIAPTSRRHNAKPIVARRPALFHPKRVTNYQQLRNKIIFPLKTCINHLVSISPCVVYPKITWLNSKCFLSTEAAMKQVRTLSISFFNRSIYPTVSNCATKLLCHISGCETKNTFEKSLKAKAKYSIVSN
jgi:hypothetical protein